MRGMNRSEAPMGDADAVSSKDAGGKKSSRLKDGDSCRAQDRLAGLVKRSL